MKKVFFILFVCLLITTISAQSLRVGQVLEDGIIAHINKDGKSGLLVTEFNLLEKPMIWSDASRMCNKIGSWSGLNVEWRLPTCDELQLIYQSLYLANFMEFKLEPEMNITGPNFWVSDRDKNYSDLPKSFNFENGTCRVLFSKYPDNDQLTVNEHLWVRAVRKFQIKG